jgi:hypothetical protein
MASNQMKDLVQKDEADAEALNHLNGPLRGSTR